MMGCTVCGSPLPSAERIDTQYRGERYEFCSDEHKEEFEATPDRFV